MTDREFRRQTNLPVNLQCMSLLNGSCFFVPIGRIEFFVLYCLEQFSYSVMAKTLIHAKYPESNHESTTTTLQFPS